MSHISTANMFASRLSNLPQGGVGVKNRQTLTNMKAVSNASALAQSAKQSIGGKLSLVPGTGRPTIGGAAKLVGHSQSLD